MENTKAATAFNHMDCSSWTANLMNVPDTMGLRLNDVRFGKNITAEQTSLSQFSLLGWIPQQNSYQQRQALRVIPLTQIQQPFGSGRPMSFAKQMNMLTTLNQFQLQSQLSYQSLFPQQQQQLQLQSQQVDSTRVLGKKRLFLPDGQEMHLLQLNLSNSTNLVYQPQPVFKRPKIVSDSLVQDKRKTRRKISNLGDYKKLTIHEKKKNKRVFISYLYSGIEFYISKTEKYRVKKEQNRTNLLKTLIHVLQTTYKFSAPSKKKMKTLLGTRYDKSIEELYLQPGKLSLDSEDEENENENEKVEVEEKNKELKKDESKPVHHIGSNKNLARRLKKKEKEKERRERINLLISMVGVMLECKMNTDTLTVLTIAKQFLELSSQ